MQNDYLFPVFSLTDIASVTSLLNNSELIIIASRPSLGKTTLALIVATHLVINQEKPVAFISLEISKDLLLKRLPKTDKLTTRDIQNSSLYIDDTPNMTFSELEYALKNLQEEKHIKGVFIAIGNFKNQQPRPEGRGMLFSCGGCTQGFNTFLTALKGGVLNPFGTNKEDSIYNMLNSWRLTILFCNGFLITIPILFMKLSIFISTIIKGKNHER